ncbi:hypothetical protein AXG93_1275s1450 [Marchantia polymorpha subsp. ruderalis]|uniref:Uncharacterized protein n=1 Tax=Marchantia polymorpha subsp. ruderalis TaxID=1480154 RepID=A0A176VLD1_MARPO|nr:hypothetical protein AXG93_1275s1450 [Marchantia polymorpha subsp. ruderalis]
MAALRIPDHNPRFHPDRKPHYRIVAEGMYMRQDTDLEVETKRRMRAHAELPSVEIDLVRLGARRARGAGGAGGSGGGADGSDREPDAVSRRREDREDQTDEERDDDGHGHDHGRAEVGEEAGPDIGSHERAGAEDGQREQRVDEVAEPELVGGLVRGLQGGGQLRRPEPAERDDAEVHLPVGRLEAVGEAREEAVGREEGGGADRQPQVLRRVAGAIVGDDGRDGREGQKRARGQQPGQIRGPAGYAVDEGCPRRHLDGGIVGPGHQRIGESGAGARHVFGFS